MSLYRMGDSTRWSRSASPATYPGRTLRARPSRMAGIDIGVHLRLKTRGLSHSRAALTIARKLAKRCYHLLRELGRPPCNP